jgi:hypothetical protein
VKAFSKVLVTTLDRRHICAGYNMQGDAPQFKPFSFQQWLTIPERIKSSQVIKGNAFEVAAHR